MPKVWKNILISLSISVTPSKQTPVRSLVRIFNQSALFLLFIKKIMFFWIKIKKNLENKIEFIKIKL